MNTENKIDNYFERVKQNPPLISIEKVHQIIDSPKAMARLKGKPYNLLKITIMTTIFASIIGAVLLLWPTYEQGKDLNVPISAQTTTINTYQAELASPTSLNQDLGNKYLDNEEESNTNEQSNNLKDFAISQDNKVKEEGFPGNVTSLPVIEEKHENSSHVLSNKIISFSPIRCFVGNEGAPSLSKFEIDLYDSDILANDLSGNYLWMSVKSNSISELKDGKYNYTNLNPNLRDAMTFSGAYFLNGIELKITGGSFVLKKTKEQISISYSILLNNQVELKGEYLNTYSNWTPQVLNKMKAYKTEELPIDGSRFLLKLTKDELRKIGFQINDTSIVYKNYVDKYLYSWNYKVRKITNKVAGSSQSFIEKYQTSNSTENYGNWKLYCKTNSFYSDLKSVEHIKLDEFDSVNDTLFPIVVPVSSINPDELDIILWFSANDEFLNILSEKHKATIDEFLKYRSAKKIFTKTDFILYKPQKLFNESKIVNLSQNELIKLGFRFSNDSTIFSGNTQTEKIEIHRSKTSTGYNRFLQPSIKAYSNIFPVLVTRMDGSPYSSANLLKVAGLDNQKYGSQFVLLIPILVKASESFYENDVIFWFYPTEELFKALPDKIGKSLLAEYKYVTAKDKSKLVQPECKYFEECENTLNDIKFKVFPNPASTQLNVSFSLNEAISGRITLVDLAGRERQVLKPQTKFAIGPHQISVDVSSVPEGIYLITLYSDKGIQTQRLIVTR